MRYLMIAFVVLVFPISISILKNQRHLRPHVFSLIIILRFFDGLIPSQVFLYSWPFWSGISTGFGISVGDSLLLALLVSANIIKRTTIFIIPLCFYGLTLLISLVPAEFKTAVLFSFWDYCRAILLFYVISIESYKKEIHQSILVGICIGLCVQIFFVIQQKMSGVVQASGTTGHQNTFGMIVEGSIFPLFAALLSGNKSFILKIGIAAGLVIVALGGSRATLGLIGGGLIALLIMSLMRHVTPLKFKCLGVFVMLLCIVGPLSYATLNKRFGGSTVFTEEDVRSAMERTAKLISDDHPFGIGANHFVLISNTRGYADRAGLGGYMANRSRPAHNAYLLTQAETGWLGKVALLLLFLIPIYAGLKFVFKERKNIHGEIALGSCAAVAVMSLHGNYEYALLVYNVLFFAMLNIGLIAAQINFAKTPKPRNKL